MFPVVSPPRFSVLFRSVWIVPDDAVSEIPFPEFAPVVAETEAVGVPLLIPVTANSADDVD